MEIKINTVLPNQPAPGYWDPLDPDNTSSVSRSIRVRDRHGIARDLTIYFRREDDWPPYKSGWIAFSAHVMVDGSEIRYGVAGVPFETDHYRLDFLPNGELDHTCPQCKQELTRKRYVRASRTGGGRNKWHWKESDHVQRITDRINVDFSGTELIL